MPNPTTNFRDSFGTDLGNKLITKEYLMSVYPQIANQLITPELWNWGYNNSGQLGNNNTSNSATPTTTLSGGANWKQVSAGFAFAAAIKTDGTLWTWGSNNDGQLGINVAAGATNNRSTPVTTFIGGIDWKQVAVGTAHVSAIKTNGTLWTWGNSFYMALGVNDRNTRITPTTTFAGGTNWKQVACGYGHTVAVKTDGTLWTWGLNRYGQLGVNTAGDATIRTTPTTTFIGGSNWKQVSANEWNCAAIKTDGSLWTWGRNNQGQLGINVAGDTTGRCTPVTTITGGNNWRQVASGVFHTAAIKTNGTLWTWGYNNDGELGINTFTNRTTPVTTFAGGTNWKQIACSTYNTYAIKTSDDLQGI